MNSELFSVQEKEDGSKYVILGGEEGSKYDYSADEVVANLIKAYRTVVFNTEYMGNLNWLPEGVLNITFLGIITQPITNLPTTTRAVSITSNGFNEAIDNLPLIESLNIRSRIFNQTPENIPPTCKNISIISKAFNYTLDAFPDTVETITLDMFDIAHTSKFPRCLQTLNLEHSLYSVKTIKAFQSKFPNLKIIYVERTLSPRQREYIRLTGINPDGMPIDVEIL